MLTDGDAACDTGFLTSIYGTPEVPSSNGAHQRRRTRWPTARPVVGQRLPQLVGAQIGRLAGEAVGDGRQLDAGIDRGGARFQSEVEILGVVEALGSACPGIVTFTNES